MRKPFFTSRIIISLMLLFISGVQQSYAELKEKDSVDYSLLMNAIQKNRSRSEKLEKALDILRIETDSLSYRIDAFAQTNQETSKTVFILNDSLVKQEKLRNELQTSFERTKTITVTGMVVLLFVLLVLTFIMFSILRKYYSLNQKLIEGDTRISTIQEDSIKYFTEIADFQKDLISNISSMSTSNTDTHTLALKIAGEITRIEVNLSRMDPNIKGYKQLYASIRRIKDSFTANGYEIVDMLGKPYNEGLNVIANFVPDDSLEEGQQIITGIIKPQVNYNGVLIQAAQVTVSQN